MCHVCADGWKAVQYRWRNYGVNLYPAKNSIVKKTTFHAQTPEGISSQFMRISYEYLQPPHRIVIHYLGQCTAATQYPHGNSVTNERNYVRLCPSVIQDLHWAAKHELPGNIYKASTGTDAHPVLHPRNNKQVQNAAYAVQHQCLSRDAPYNLLKISYHIPNFVHKVTIHPNLLVVCGSTTLINLCDTALLSSPHDRPALLSYDTTFCLGDLYVSVLLFRMVIYAESPVLPVLIFIHNTKTAAAHKEFFETALQLLPNLKDLPHC